MRLSRLVIHGIVIGGLALLAGSSACGNKSDGSGFSNGSGPGGGTSGNGGGDNGGPSLGSGGGGQSSGPTAQKVCPAGLSCTTSCGSGTTTVSGKVYDPAGKDPLYDIVVYVPEKPLTPLPRGVPTGGDSCSCGAYFASGAYTSATTGTDGSFTLNDVPVGSDVPLVIQIGKWRRVFHIGVTACQDNPQPDKSLAFLGTVPASDTDDNMPDIAVSTGEADTLECLMLRIGVPATEYVAGAAMTGHVHVFSGGASDGSIVYGQAESPAMAGAPPSPTSLWANQDQLMPYDITLLSCEGDETYNANPPALEGYLNAGGRVFASHYHYSWFAGPISSMQNYSAPPDWGTNLATWLMEGQEPNGPIGGIIDQTLNGSTMPFPKGVALDKWLGVVNALGAGVFPGELPIYQPRFNAIVGPTNTPSQPWITSDITGQLGATMYFSFNTPVQTGPLPPDSTGPTYCGRAVFSDLHVGGNPSTNDMSPPPGGCDNTDLSPQEKALEFMIFDLSGCVIPDTMAPPDAGIPPQTVQ
jgi:hypothetical protein